MKIIKPGILPRTSFSLFILTVPYLKGKELKSAIRNQLVGIFPGNLEEQIIEIRRNRGKRWSYLVFVLKMPGPEKPVVISTLFIQEYFAGKSAKVIYISDTWIEYVSLEDGSVSKSIVKTRSEDLPGCLAGLLNNNGDFQDANIHVFCIRKEHSVINSIPDKSFIIHIIEKESARMNMDRVSLFIHLSPKYQRKKALFVLLFLGIFIAFFTLLSERRSDLAMERQKRLQEQEILNRQKEAEERELKILEELRTRYQGLAASKQVTPYEIIEIISKCLNSETRIISETIRENFFQFEAVAPDALEVLRVFEENDQVRSPIIQQIHPSGNSERFVITGTVVPRIEVPRQGMDAKEQRVNLERLINTLEENEYGNVKYTPSHFGASIRGLLSKWGCPITSYQYINNEENRQIEFSIQTESGKFFGFLQEAIRPENGWYFKLIQIRNLSPLNLLDIVFRISGNIDFDDDTLPGIADDGNIGIPVEITRITKNYYTRPPVPRAAAPVILPEEPPEEIEVKPEKASWIEFIGIVGDHKGTQYIYVKDRRDGKVLRLSPDTEDDPAYVDLQNGSYEVRIEGKNYEFGRNQ
jgi:hypothetical protein